jgi:nitrous oxidase accessory protein
MIMGRARAILFAAIIAVCAAMAAHAATVAVPAGDGLQAAVTSAVPGDVLVLAPGLHRGGVVIATPELTLAGMSGAIIDGGGEGRVITLAAAKITIRGLVIRNAGRDILAKEAGVFIGHEAGGAAITENHFIDNAVGVFLDDAAGTLVQHNRFEGLRQLRMSERGPGVAIYGAHDAKVLDNAFRYGRDGVFAVTSMHLTVGGNHFRDLRFAVHFMYSNSSVVFGNTSIGNDIGYAMMYSDHLELQDNVSENDRDHGMLFNYANYSRIADNVVRGGDKCVFIYNANKNRLVGNWFEGCRVGIHFTAGSEGNAITGNAFIDNRTQVKYVGTRLLDWAEHGRGNYWSDNPAFDLQGRGIADTAYRPNDIVDQVVWRAPSAKLLLNSPAVEVLRWAQAAFPALHPGGVIDSAPLMAPVRPAALARLAGAPEGDGRP